MIAFNSFEFFKLLQFLLLIYNIESILIKEIYFENMIID